ncbi:MAG: 5-deoxy-5-amino-3-dehydroquinate synthase [Acidimicrobiaceae bacterium]|nr:5-deoxy-5-amino-3-dehydroquinate synthase [Acidimicrobiaceae bacterium]
MRSCGERWRARGAAVLTAGGGGGSGSGVHSRWPRCVVSEVREVKVELGERSYTVVVGAGARHRLLEVLPVGARKAAIVSQDSIPVTVDAGIEQAFFPLDDGEEAKCVESVEQLCRAWTRWGLTRADVVVAVGGGVVTDTAGFAAAVYHRGVAVIHVPTTLLGQVDAAIGGKTGVNLPEGKNLVGAFWQPAAVLCDTETLLTLPPREYRSGLGEMAKYAFLGVADLPDLALDDAVAACVACKADVVGSDEREGPSGRRALLNYGHTLAHALETVGRYDLRHGEAVAIGLAFAARLALRLGRIDSRRVDQHDAVLAGYDLPSVLPPDTDIDEVIRVMARDKKATAGLTFVLDAPGGLEVVAGVSECAVRDALDMVRAP